MTLNTVYALLTRSLKQTESRQCLRIYVQELSLLIRSELLLREVQLTNDPRELHRVQTRSFVDSQEFHLYQHIQTSFPHLIKDQTLTKAKRPSLRVTCFVARRPMYFVWNVFLVIVELFLLLFFLSFSSMCGQTLTS